MPRDLGFLLRPLEASSEQLESVDPRLEALSDLAKRGQYAAAADRAYDLIAAGIYDIRPLSYYFFQAFLEGGFAALGDVLDGLSMAMGESFEAIGPSKKREDNFDKRLAWLFETLAETIEYHELKRTPEWSAWHVDVTHETIERAIRGTEAVAQKIASGQYENAARSLGLLTNRLRAHAETLKAPARAEPAKKVSVVPPPPPAAGVYEAPIDPLRCRVELAVSHHFVELTAKLRAFEVLVEKSEFEKAALVADDLLHVVENFDPRSYFPELFARFGALFSKNIVTISSHLDQRESVGWKALGQYYRVDMKSFVDT